MRKNLFSWYFSVLEDEKYLQHESIQHDIYFVFFLENLDHMVRSIPDFQKFYIDELQKYHIRSEFFHQHHFRVI